MYEILAKFPGLDWEVVDEADDKETRDYLVSEYRVAYGPTAQVKSKKKR